MTISHSLDEILSDFEDISLKSRRILERDDVTVHSQNPMIFSFIEDNDEVNPNLLSWISLYDNRLAWFGGPLAIRRGEKPKLLGKPEDYLKIRDNSVELRDFVEKYLRMGPIDIDFGDSIWWGME